MASANNPIIFLLGRPGCGKSVIFKILSEEFRKERIAKESLRIDDFPVLKELLDKDKEFKRHIKKDGGFAVTDWTVVDEVLQIINQRIYWLLSPDKVVFIEFARANYSGALKNFSDEILKNSILLYIKASLETCLKRNEARFIEAGNKDIDAHIVPPDLMKTYYKEDDFEKMQLEELKKISPADAFIIDNDKEGIEELKKQLLEFVKFYSKKRLAIS